ncbi:MAG: phage tail tape measure protein [Acidobacteriota bacterium]|nr:phage tail tape measure protein [Acidobacteriota bacterium]
MRQETRQLATSMLSLRGVVAGFAAGGAGIGLAIRSIASFEDRLAAVRAVSRATGADFDRLKEQARDLGRSTRFTAAQAAEGQLFLARAGLETQEILRVLPGTLRLAQVGELELGEAADFATNALAAFRLEADQAARVVDVLAAGSSSSNTDVRQLADGLKLVAPAAVSLGVDLEATVAAIGKLSDAGLQATLAGTGLRQVLFRLADPSAEAQRILDGLGVTAADLSFRVHGLAGVIENLRDAGITAQQAISLFGARGQPAFSNLVANVPALRELEEALRNSAGEAERMAAIMDDTLIGSARRAVSAIAGFIEVLSEVTGLSWALRTALDLVAGALGLATDAMLALQTGAGFLIDAFLSLIHTLGDIGRALSIIGQDWRNFGVLAVDSLQGIVEYLLGIPAVFAGVFRHGFELAVDIVQRLPDAIAVALKGGTISEVLFSDIEQRLDHFLDLLVQDFGAVELPDIAGLMFGDDVAAAARASYGEAGRAAWDAFIAALKARRAAAQGSEDDPENVITIKITESAFPNFGGRSRHSGLAQWGEFIRLQEQARERMDALRESGVRFGESLGRVFADALTGVRSLSDGLRALAQQLLSSLFQHTFGALFGRLVPGLFGGDSLVPIPRQHGGLVEEDELYLVGERGPELFVPGGRGRVVSNRDLTGFGGPRGLGASTRPGVFDRIGEAIEGLVSRIVDGARAAIDRVRDFAGGLFSGRPGSSFGGPRGLGADTRSAGVAGAQGRGRDAFDRAGRSGVREFPGIDALGDSLGRFGRGFLAGATGGGLAGRFLGTRLERDPATAAGALGQFSGIATAIGLAGFLGGPLGLVTTGLGLMHAMGAHRGLSPTSLTREAASAGRVLGFARGAGGGRGRGGAGGGGRGGAGPKGAGGTGRDFSIDGRQFGGQVSAGMPYVVGEAGPELFVPNVSGRIDPRAVGGGDSLVVNLSQHFQIESSDGPGVRAALAQAAPQLVDASVAAVTEALGRRSPTRAAARRI